MSHGISVVLVAYLVASCASIPEEPLGSEEPTRSAQDGEVVVEPGARYDFTSADARGRFNFGVIHGSGRDIESLLMQRLVYVTSDGAEVSAIIRRMEKPGLQHIINVRASEDLQPDSWHTVRVMTDSALRVEDSLRGASGSHWQMRFFTGSAPRVVAVERDAETLSVRMSEPIDWQHNMPTIYADGTAVRACLQLSEGCVERPLESAPGELATFKVAISPKQTIDLHFPRQLAEVAFQKLRISSTDWRQVAERSVFLTASP